MKLTEENLEYVTYVAREYCHLPELNDEYSKLSAATHAKSIFKARYETLEQDYQESYQIYNQNDKIKSTIDIYGLNPDKLWLLFLFITDLSDSCFAENVDVEEYTIYDFCKESIAMIEQEENIKITVTSSEKQISLSNPSFVAAFRLLCQIESCQYTEIARNGRYYQTALDEKGKNTTKKIKFFVEMFRFFLDNHVTVRKPSKMTFIGKFLFLAKFVLDESYLTEYHLVPITKRNRYFAKIYGTVTINDKEYIKEPIDTGKRIADNIKDCSDTAPTGHSNYIDEPFDL